MPPTTVRSVLGAFSPGRDMKETGGLFGKKNRDGRIFYTQEIPCAMGTDGQVLPLRTASGAVCDLRNGRRAMEIP